MNSPDIIFKGPVDIISPNLKTIAPYHYLTIAHQQMLAVPAFFRDLTTFIIMMQQLEWN